MKINHHGLMIDDKMYQYMRMHPKWYILLSRYPDQLDAFIYQYRLDNHCTVNDYIAQIGTILQMIEMLV